MSVRARVLGQNCDAPDAAGPRLPTAPIVSGLCCMGRCQWRRKPKGGPVRAAELSAGWAPGVGSGAGGALRFSSRARSSRHLTSTNSIHRARHERRLSARDQGKASRGQARRASRQALADRARVECAASAVDVALTPVRREQPSSAARSEGCRCHRIIKLTCLSHSAAPALLAPDAQHDALCGRRAHPPL